jgi:hypothetical protein
MCAGVPVQHQQADVAAGTHSSSARVATRQQCQLTKVVTCRQRATQTVLTLSWWYQGCM